MGSMRKLNSILLEQKIVTELLKHSPHKKYLVEAPLFYEGQIPIVAFLLVEGCIQLLKKKKTKKNLKAGSLIGYKEMMSNSPAELSATVQPDSTVCFLDKSTIKEILLEKNSLLAQILVESDVT